MTPMDFITIISVALIALVTFAYTVHKNSYAEEF